MARLTSDFWVRAYIRRLQIAAIPVYVTRKGDEIAGAIVVKLLRPGGQAEALERSFDLQTGQRCWVTLAQGENAAVDAVLARACARDPDLWLIEVESDDGGGLLDEPGLTD